MWSRCPNVLSDQQRPAFPAAALFLAAVLSPAAGSALELQAAAQVTSEYTSNTLLTETDEIGEWIFMPGVDFSAEQDTASLEMDIDYSYLRRMFTKDYWEDENRLVGLAAIDWHALPERLDFFLNNAVTESTIQAELAETPGNRQRVSTTEAGSRLRFQPRAADELQLEYLFRDVSTTESSRGSSQRNEGTARYLLGLSENRSLTAVGTYSDIRYDNSPFPDAEYWVATAGYRQSTGTVELELNVGYNWYERDGRGRTSDPVYSGELTWAATSTVEFSLAGSMLITDQGSGLASGDTAYENTDVNAAFEETTGSVGYRHLLGANTVTLEGYWTRQEYADDVPLTNTRVGGRFDFSRNLTRTTRFQAFADFSNRDFPDEGDDQDELRAGFRVDHRLGRALNLNWGVRYEDRSAELSRSYEEWVGDIQILWTFLGAQRTPGR